MFLEPSSRAQSGSSRKKDVPLEARLGMFERTKELRKSGLSYSRIRTVLLEEQGVAPSKSTISEWLQGVHDPLGSANRFVAKPSPELAYVIGVKFGDGSINRKGYSRRIRLQAIDSEFVAEFDRCVSSVLESGRHSLWPDSERREVHLEVSSVLLYNFLNQSWERLRSWIEHCEKCVSAFLRGFFDSEGSTRADGEFHAYNNDTSLLQYVQRLLVEFFKIETTGPHLGKRKGSPTYRRGRVYLRNYDSYSIYVLRESVARFARHVGFTIERKHACLEAALQRKSPRVSLKKAPGVGFEPTRPEGHGLTGL